MGDEKKTVFISHSSRDAKAATLTCLFLERMGHGCWISSRDIDPHKSWAGEITKALRQTELVVLLLSKNSNQSEEVLKEINLAADKKMPFLTYLLEDIKPCDDLKYHLATRQWVEGSNPPTNRNLSKLGAAVYDCLAEKRSGSWGFSPSLLFAEGRRIRTTVWLSLMIAAVVLLGIFGAPYLQERFGNTGEITPAEVELQDGQDDSLSTVVQDTSTVQDDLADITGQTPPVPVTTTGTVNIRSTPSNASVTINSSYAGRTPLLGYEIVAGPYTAVIRRDGYHAEPLNRQVGPGGSSDVEVVLKRMLSTLEVTSTPTGADVVLNDRLIGITPFTFERLTGEDHTVVVSLVGYKTREDSVKLTAGELYRHNVRLERLVGFLTVTVIPDGSIKINGEQRRGNSNAPYDVELLPGRYEVKAHNSLHGDWTKTIEIADGNHLSLEFDYSPTYDITITSSPGNAAIIINGMARRLYTPQSVPFRPGDLTLDVSLEGYISPGVRTLTVEEGLDEFIHFDLLRRR